MKIYTQKEAASQIKVSPRSVGKLIKQGIVRPRKKTRRGRRQNWFTEDDVKKMIDCFYPIREVREIMAKRYKGYLDDPRRAGKEADLLPGQKDERVSCESRSLTGEEAIDEQN